MILYPTFFIFSFYGVLILIRFIAQLFFANENNKAIFKLIRPRILSAAERKKFLCISKKRRQMLVQISDYREFKNQLYSFFPELQNPAIWSSIIWQTFFDLGFSSLDTLPPVRIVIPVFRPESLEEVQATLHSLREQSYPAIREILISFNDSEKVEMEKILKKEVQKVHQVDNRVQFHSISIASKRSAMFVGFQKNLKLFLHSQMTYRKRAQFYPEFNSITLNIDADTRIEHDAVALGVLLLLLDPATTAITSNVEIRNERVNFLTRLTAARYKSANMVERAAQSYFKTVRCMSGPFMMFWTRNLLSISPRGKLIGDEWVNEHFLNVKVEPGDDRSWTVRHNEQKLGVSFHPDILVTTDCPMSWKRWSKQQLRWLRSSNRNFIISLPFLHRLPIYIIFDDLYLFLFPFLLFAILSGLAITCLRIALTFSLMKAISYVLPYISVVIFFQMVKAIHLSLTQRDAKYLWLALYFFVYVRYLIWLRIWSIFTITQSEWTGRSAADFLADQNTLKRATLLGLTKSHSAAQLERCS